MLNHCHGQCYNGAATMCGRRTGVATQIEKEGAQGHVYSLYGSFSQLTVQDTCRSIKVISDTFDTVSNFFL